MKLIILDRDGVINEDSDNFIKSPKEWVPIKGSLEAISKLSQAGYHIAVITNQSGIGRGLFDADTLGKIHVRMLDQVQQHGGKIEIILFCPHSPDHDCDCRKPKAGLYDELATRLNTSFTNVYSVGDSIRDIEAAHNAGALPVLVKTGKGKLSHKKLKQGDYPELSNWLVYDSLAKFVDALLNKTITSVR